jgi:hypothetical protein
VTFHVFFHFTEVFTTSGPAPRADRLKKVGVALRSTDQEILRRLSLEGFIHDAAAGANRAAMYERLFERGERPSVSSAIRYLIDSERGRRTAIANEAWKAVTRAAPPPAAHLIQFDLVFGDSQASPKGSVEAAFAREYAEQLLLQQRIDLAHGVWPRAAVPPPSQKTPKKKHR